MNVAHHIRRSLAHLLGRVSGRHYYEDFVRVYPDGLRSQPPQVLSVRRPVRARQAGRRHWLRQRLRLQDFFEGAVAVRGGDASKEAIDFACQRYSSVADFTVQSITALDASRMIRST